MKYRADIDGLRALAVLPVVLFHAKAPGFSGGYVGVDVFFVISGFLITGVLLEDHEKARYSIRRFYDRRIRRIFPALFCMMAVVSVFAALFLVPSELRTYARTLAATVVFGSNVLFWRASGYFAPAAEDNLLLHTWSLAVEEQYYIVFPLALWLIYRMRASRFLPVLLGAGVLGSLALAQITLKSSSVAAFFLLPTRAWELLLGAWLASWRPERDGPRGLRELGGWVGLAMIGASVALYSPRTQFPGVAALLPCVGALLVLWSGRAAPTSASRLLASRPLVFVGLISYSLYLWHWPLLVFPRLYLVRELTPLEAVGAVAASAVIAVLSWRFVERPFRGRREVKWRLTAEQRSIAVGVLTMIVLIGAAGAMWTGLPGRLPARAAALDELPWAPKGATDCETLVKSSRTHCATRPVQAGGEVALWGDSHALQYLAAMRGLSRERGMSLRTAILPSCAPLLGVTPVDSRGVSDLGCVGFNKRALKAILADPQIKTVVLAGRWSRFFFPPGDTARQVLLANDRPLTDFSHLLDPLDATVTALEANGKSVVIVGQSPEFEGRLPPCLAATAWRGQPESRCQFKPETMPSSPYRAAMAGLLARHPAVHFVDPAQTLCPGSHCVRTVTGIPVTRDNDHLSGVAAELVINRNSDKIAPAAGSPQA